MPVGSSGGGGPKAGDVRAGGAFVEVSLRDRLSQSLAGVKKKFEAFAKFSSKIGIGLFGAGATGAAAIGKLFGDALDRGNEFQTLAEKFGTTTEKVSALAYAFKTAGVPVEQFGDSLKDFSAKLSQAADGNDDTFSRLGLSARELMNLPLDEQFARIADAIAAVQNPADQSRMAMEIFGGAGEDLLPTLKKGRAGLAEMGVEASRVGEIMSGETAKKAQDASRSIGTAWTSIKSVALAVGEALLDNTDVIKEVAGWVVNIAKTSREWVAENKEVVTTVAMVTAGVAAAGAALIALGVAGGVASAAMAGIATAVVIVKALVAAFAGLLGPVGLVTAGVAALIALWVTQTDSGQAFVSNLGDGLSAMADRAKKAFSGIKAALSSGDLRTAGRIALLGLELEFAKGVAGLMPIWNGFKDFFVDGFHDSVKLIKLLLNDLDEYFSDTFLSIIKGLNDAFGDGIKGILDRLIGVITQLPAAVRKTLGLNSLKEELELFSGAFGSSGFSDELDRQRKMNEEEHRKQRNKIHKDATDEQDARNDARKADQKEADDLVGRLQKELEDIINQAIENAKPSLGKAGIGAIGDGAGNLPPKLPTLDAMRSDVKGGFATPLLARQFGIGDTVAKRQLAAAEKQVKVQEKELPKINAGIKDIGAALTFRQ